MLLLLEKRGGTVVFLLIAVSRFLTLHFLETYFSAIILDLVNFNLLFSSIGDTITFVQVNLGMLLIIRIEF